MCYWTSKRKHNDGADATHCNLVVLGFLSYREGCGSVWRQGEVFSIQSDGSEFYWRFEGQIKRIILTSTWSFCLPQGSPKIFLEVMWLWVFRVVTIFVCRWKDCFRKYVGVSSPCVKRLWESHSGDGAGNAGSKFTQHNCTNLIFPLGEWARIPIGTS